MATREIKKRCCACCSEDRLHVHMPNAGAHLGAIMLTEGLDERYSALVNSKIHYACDKHKADPIQDGFDEFHAANPAIFTAFVGFARKLKAAGHRKGSAKLIIERIRWEYAITTTDPDFKVNNSYTSRYARLAMEACPDLAGFFETRMLHTQGDR